MVLSNAILLQWDWSLRCIQSTELKRISRSLRLMEQWRYLAQDANQRIAIPIQQLRAHIAIIRRWCTYPLTVFFKQCNTRFKSCTKFYVLSEALKFRSTFFMVGIKVIFAKMYLTVRTLPMWLSNIWCLLSIFLNQIQAPCFGTRIALCTSVGRSSLILGRLGLLVDMQCRLSCRR